MAIHPTLACSLQQRIGLQWEQQNFSDITVVVEDTSFQCHKLILGACSEYFQGLFRSQMKESFENRVELQCITKDTFSVILDSIYKGADGLTEENVLDVWSASDRLMMDYLVTHCESFLIKNMTVENCFYFYRQGLLHSSSSVKRYFFDFSHKNFEALRGSSIFLEFSIDEVYEIVESDNLVAESEDSVADAVVDWLEYNPQTTESPGSAEEVGGRKEHAAKLLSLVRLSLLSPACLRRLSQLDFVLSCKKAHEMIIGAMYYTFNIENRHHKWHASAIHRLTSQMKHVMVFGNDAKIMVYMLDTGTLHEHSQSPYSEPVGLTVFENVLYMCSDNTDLSMYTDGGSWKKVADQLVVQHSATTYTFPLPFDELLGLTYLAKHMLLPHKNHIYCLYKYKHRFLRYNCSHGHENKWTLCTSKPVCADSLVRFNQYILLFSTNNNKINTRCFNTNTLKFIKIAPENSLEGSLNDIVSFSDRNDVFILQRNGNLWKIISTESSLVDFCLVSKLWVSVWYTHGAIIYRQKLFVFLSTKVKTGSGNKDVDFLLETGCPRGIPGLCEEIKFVDITSDTQFLPMVLPMKA